MDKEKDNVTTFSLSIYGNITDYNEVLSKARCRIFYTGANRNGTFITEEFAEKLISTLPYVPVKGIYDTMKDDYTDHGRERYEGRIYGIVPENPNFAWEKHLDVDGVERTYACTDVYLFTGLYKQEAFDIVGKSQSMELYVDSIEGEWQYINGKRFFVFTEGRFLGLQTLGEDYEPCFEGASFYTLVDSVKALMNDLQDTNVFQKQNLGGEKHMNFKLSDNQKYNMIWSLLNPRFNEENDYVMDYAVCDVYDEYAVVFKFETNAYERAYYTKNDETDSLAIDKMEDCYIVDVNEEEKRALEVLHAMNNNTYEKIDEVVTDLQNKVDSFSSKNEENETAIATLQQDKERLENELEEVNGNYTTALETIDTLTSEKNELNEFKVAAELKEKEAVIEKYVTLIDEEQINNFKEKIDEFTKEELDKELAFVLVQTKSTIFTNDESTDVFVFVNKINFVTGESYTLAEFFSGNRRIVIPDLQRDYCWGDKTHTNERKELVSGFIDTLVNHYKNYRMEIDKLSLGLIYGYEVPANHIQLCDGQQRMTTLFLLLGMLNKKSTENFFQSLLISDYELSDDKEPYLQYSVRETSLYFLSDLVCHFFIRNAKDNDYVEKVSDIWHGTWFFNEYRTDPSIRSMISALEIIENLLKDKDETWCCQFGDFLINRLTFLYYDMETRKNGEETFVVINTTGEPLSSTQNLKPLVVQADKNKYFEATHHKTPAIAWEEIETWFWKNREPKSNDTADAGFAEFLRWISIIELTKKGGSSDVVRTILSKGKYSFNYNEISLETILNYWETIKRLFPENGGEFTNEKSFLSPSDNDFYADTGKYKLKALSQIECFRLLPVIAYCNNNGCDLTDRNALRLYHFVDNLSRIENIQKNVNPLVEEAISIALTCTDIIELLQQENQDKFSKSILTEEEIDKLRILDNNPSRNDIEEEFWYAQKHPILQGEILPLIEWTKLNGSFNIANFKTIRSHFEQIFPRGTKAVTDLTRRSLLTYGLPEYPRGNSFGYSAEEWKGIICANSKKIAAAIKGTASEAAFVSAAKELQGSVEDLLNFVNKFKKK